MGAAVGGVGEGGDLECEGCAVAECDAGVAGLCPRGLQAQGVDEGVATGREGVGDFGRVCGADGGEAEDEGCGAGHRSDFTAEMKSAAGMS